MLTSTSGWILVPMTLQILLTLVVLVRLGRAKVAAFRAKEVNKERFGIDDDAWPDSVRLIDNNLRNQFETPVLFYVLCLTLYALNAGGWIAVVVATVYFFLRCLHAHEHTGRNYVIRRRQLFIYALTALLVLLVLTLVALGRTLMVFHGL